MLRELFAANFETLKSLLEQAEGIDDGSVFFNLPIQKDACIDYLNKNPYFFFALGFEETRTFLCSKSRINDNYDYSSKISETSLLKKNGSWFEIDSMIDYWPGHENRGRHNGLGDDFAIVLKNYRQEIIDLSIWEFKRAVKDYDRDENHKIIWLPNDLINSKPLEKIIGVQSTTVQLIKEIQRANILLDELGWQDFEDIMAEIYKNQGFKVMQTLRTRDGGRDLIVSGEFIPGINLKMAVELTTQKYVDKNKVAKAIVDNRDFPLIMIATTGNFSLGVKNLLNSPDYQLRLKLADKIDVLDWVGRYK